MAGTRTRVWRILAAAAVLVALAAGCGGAVRPHERAAREVPRVLARDWANQASAIADAYAAGDSCHALQLASSLRNEVIAEEGRVPSRLRGPLLSGVNSLADRITCRQTVTVQAPPPKPPQPPPPKHDHHDHQGHGHDDKKAHG